MAETGSTSEPTPDRSPVRLLRNPLSIAGAMMTTVTAVVFLVFFLADLVGLTETRNPYIGIVFFIALPAVFVISLLLIPLGAWLERRRRGRGRPPVPFVGGKIRHCPRSRHATGLGPPGLGERSHREWGRCCR